MIAILGATGYIGRSLAREFVKLQRPMSLFARDPSRLADEEWPSHVRLRSIDEFTAGDFELVINSIGAGDPGQVATMGAQILDITNFWDSRVLSTMTNHTKYVFLSSGAVYGSFDNPVGANSEIKLPVNNLGTVPAYTMAKLYAEARHRYSLNRSILDLRVFAYADASISRTGNFFLSQLAKSVAEGSAFRTTPGEMTRDYAGSIELASLIQCWIKAGAPNRAADLRSKQPVSKWTLLRNVEKRYGLRIDIVEDLTSASTGVKPVYASDYDAAYEIGHVPVRTSQEVVFDALDIIWDLREH